MKFEKWQALGNDYLILERANLPWELNSKRIAEWARTHPSAKQASAA